MNGRRLADVRTMAAGQLIEVFPIHMARSSSFLALVALLLIVPWAYVAVGGAVAALYEGRLPVAAGLAPFATGLGWATFKIFREAFPGPAHVAIVPGGLAVRHPLLLRRRLEVPMDRIELVGVIDGALPRTDEPCDLGGDQTAPPPPLPLVSHVVTDVPNVAVAFREPVDLTAIRRKPISSRGPTVFRLSDVDVVRGFVARVEDPEAFARAFDRWRVVAPPGAGAGDDRRSIGRRVGIVGAAFLIASIVDALQDLF